MHVVTKVLLLILINIVLAQNSEKWLDFSCYDTFRRWEFPRLIEECFNLEKWDQAPRAKCFKACQLIKLDILEPVEHDDWPIRIKASDYTMLTMTYLLPRNDAVDVVTGIQECSHPDVIGPINDKKLPCSEWDPLYKCVESKIKCMEPGNALSSNTWLDFSCHPGYNKEAFDRQMEDCTKIETSWKYSAKAKCFKSCQLNVHGFITLWDDDRWPFLIPSDYDFRATFLHDFLSRNGHLAKEILLRVMDCFQKNKEEIADLTDKGWHCNYWDVLYKCAEEGIKCQKKEE